MILKDLHPALPVVHVTAIEQKKQLVEGFYMCPCYVTSSRGATFVFQTYLKMESDESDENLWILAGVALLMAPE
jgi:dynein heavy chain